MVSPRAARTEPRTLSGELPHPNSPNPPLQSGLVFSVSGRGRRASSRRALERPGQCTSRPSEGGGVAEHAEGRPEEGEAGAGTALADDEASGVVAERLKMGSRGYLAWLLGRNKNAGTAQG